jgi:hypothetical protein
MVSCYGTGTQQKTVSWPLTIHPSWCAVAITLLIRRRLFHRNPKCGLSGAFLKLGCIFFCFASFCEREVERRWVQHTPPCDVEIQTYWTFSARPHPPLLPSTLERWTEGELWLCYISLIMGHEHGCGVLPSLACLLLQLVWLCFTLSPSHLYVCVCMEWSAEFNHWIVEIKK